LSPGDSGTSSEYGGVHHGRSPGESQSLTKIALSQRLGGKPVGKTNVAMEQRQVNNRIA